MLPSAKPVGLFCLSLKMATQRCCKGEQSLRSHLHLEEEEPLAVIAPVLNVLAAFDPALAAAAATAGRCSTVPRDQFHVYRRCLAQGHRQEYERLSVWEENGSIQRKPTWTRGRTYITPHGQVLSPQGVESRAKHCATGTIHQWLPLYSSSWYQRVHVM